jgi:ABC-type transporter Mla subunit MlaD
LAFEKITKDVISLIERLDTAIISMERVSSMSLEVSASTVESSSDMAGAIASIEASSGQLENISEKVGSSSESISKNLGKTNEIVEKSKSNIDKIIDELDRNSDSIFTDLLEKVSRFSTDWNSRLEEALISTVEGGITIQEFLSEFGDFVLTLDDGKVTIDEFLQGIDPRLFEERFQQIRILLQRETLELEQVVEILNKMKNKAAQDLLSVLHAFQQGHATLRELEEAFEAARKFFPGEDDILDDVVDELEEIIRRGGA